jgi:uncharacterized protein
VASSLLIVADTHVPKRARDLPAELWQQIESADVVVHAGDWVDVALLDELEGRARRLVGVHGNNDHGALRRRLPEVARAEIAGVRLGVVHETGLRLLNPGSPTDRRRQPFCTYLTAAASGGSLHDVELHRLLPRTP